MAKNLLTTMLKQVEVKYGLLFLVSLLFVTMVPIDTPRKRTRILVIALMILMLSAGTASAATSPKTAAKAPVKKTATTAVKAKTAKTVAKTVTKTAATAKSKTQVKGEKVTATSVSVVGDNTISTYTVKKGDTLGSIAQKFDISVNTIRWSNNLTSKSAIKIGQKITILPTSGVVYAVKTGDTLSGIAVKFAADQDDILNSNNLDNANSLKVGMKLVIPNVEPSPATDAPAEGVVGPAQNIVPIAQPSTTDATPPAQVQTPAAAPVTITQTPSTTTMVVTNPVTSDTYPITVTTPATSLKYSIPSNDIRGYYSQPVSGRLSQGIHDVNAVDIATPVGTTVHAAADGTVIVAKGDGKYNGGYGNYVVVAHPNGTQTLYAHLSQVIAGLGAVVVQDQPIALSGRTGKVTGAHLHFEIRGAANPWGGDKTGTTYSI